MIEKETSTRYHDWLIPILAVLVIFQTLILASTLSKKDSFSRLKGLVPVGESKIVPGSLAKLHFVPSGVSLKKDEVVTVDLFLTPKKPLKLDGADVVLNFDPKILQVTQVTTPKLFSFVSQKKEKENEGKIYLTFLEEKANGLLLAQEVKLLTISLKGKTLGESPLSIVVAEEGPTTVITESKTSKKLVFDQEDLKLVVH